MVAEVFAGIGAFNSMFSLAKGLRDIDDAVKRNAAIAELGEQIISAQARYTAAAEQVAELKEQLRDLETWEAKKECYELKAVGWGAFAYMLKQAERGIKPPHFVCANCYERKFISIFQHAFWKPGGTADWGCPSCKSPLRPDIDGEIRWID